MKRKSGKNKILKEMLKGKKYIVIKTDDKTYARTRKLEKQAYKELEKKTIAFDEIEVIDDKKLDELENAFKKLRKEGIENEKKMQKETLYIDYFGEIIPLHEALDRFYREGVPNKKK